MTLTVLGLMMGTALAGRMPLDPQTRIHAGFSLAEIEDPGVSLGLDSRLTRLIYVDLGAFISVGVPGNDGTTGGADEQLQLRHALYVAPGVRLPHRHKEGLNWDLIGRGGFATTWTSDAYDDHTLQAAPALLAGLDGLIRKDHIGLRASGRMLFYRGYSKGEQLDLVMIRPQVALEALYQW